MSNDPDGKMSKAAELFYRVRRLDDQTTLNLYLHLSVKKSLKKDEELLSKILLNRLVNSGIAKKCGDGTCFYIESKANYQSTNSMHYSPISDNTSNHSSSSNYSNSSIYSNSNGFNFGNQRKMDGVFYEYSEKLGYWVAFGVTAPGRFLNSF